MEELDTITLPSPPPEPARARVPLAAAIVPVIAGVVMWTVTGSLLALCFAALGPLMMLASLFDGGRVRRRERRKAMRDAEEQWDRAADALARRQDSLRSGLWRTQPGVAACLREQPVRQERIDAGTRVVLGSGSLAVAHDTSGGEGERARAFRQQAAVLPHAPISVALGAGLGVRAPFAVAAAIARAVVVQLCARFAPAQLALLGDDLDRLGIAGMPHAQHPSTGAFRLALVIGAHEVRGADAVVRLVGAAEALAGVSVVIDAHEPTAARVRTSDGEVVVRAEGLSRAQAAAVAAEWTVESQTRALVPSAVTLEEVLLADAAEGLSVGIARGTGGTVVVDLVADGPHAIVTGMTGSGKSELLVTWVIALAHGFGPEEVSFVLADFKGGTAFDPLRALSQVTAVITDLDEDGARRGVESLRAELRRREAVLADSAARDIADAAVRMPRLVIVVDEFAALLREHPGLAEVFTDIAARGRALGMHLILGTQRAAGVVSEALAANSPLRISLRVTEAADSRAVVGTDAAATLPGDWSGRGLALIRRPRDAEAQRARVALTDAADIARARVRWKGHTPAARPWLPALPLRLALADLDARAFAPGNALLGVADQPAHQRQESVGLRLGEERGLVVLGGPSSGKSGILALLAAQAEQPCIVPQDAEEAWDTITELAQHPRPGLIICDDLDAALAAYPPEYAQEFLQNWESVIRHAGAAGATIAVAASRVTTGVARLAELLPRRALLAYPSRTEYLAAGGEAQNFLARCPAGRGRLDGHLVQFALSPAELPSPSSSTRPWVPEMTTAIIAPYPGRYIGMLRARHPSCEVLSVAECAERGVAPDGATLVVGDGEAWQRGWALWQRLREDADVLVLAPCATELRTLLGMRELPPYARAHQGRAWLVRSGASPQRVSGLDLVAEAPAVEPFAELSRAEGPSQTPP